MSQPISFLTDPNDLTRVDLSQIQISQAPEASLETTVKPRRRLGDNKDDELIGGLIQKTKAIHLETGEDAKVMNLLFKLKGIGRR